MSILKLLAVPLTYPKRGFGCQPLLLQALKRIRQIDNRRTAGHDPGRAGATVTVIDADPNRPIAKWAQHAGKPYSLTVLSEVTESTIIDTIEESGRRTKFVIIDLEGSASLTVCLAISRADLVIIPTQGS